MGLWKRIKQDWHIRAYMLLLAILLWIVVVMTREYETTVLVPISATNTRIDKILTSELPETIPVRFTGQGKDLFLLSTVRPARFSIDLRSIERDVALPLAAEMVVIPNGVNATPLYLPGVDTLRVNLDDRLSIRIPIDPNVEVRTKPGYLVSEVPTVTPDSVTIEGAASRVERIDRARTEERVFVGLTDSFEETVPLVIPRNVTLTPASVQLAVTIDRLGERTIQRVPVQIEGNAQGRLVILEPSVIDVRVKGAASRLAQLNTDSIRASVSLAQWRSDQRSYPPTIELPEGIELMDTTPAIVRMRLEVDSWR